MANLYNETINFIHELGYHKKDVAFCTLKRRYNRKDYEVQFDFETFKQNAKDLNYHDGYGGQEIDASLKIVFKDGNWIERFEYDGAENWEFKEIPTFKHEKYFKHDSFPMQIDFINGLFDHPEDTITAMCKFMEEQNV